MPQENVELAKRAYAALNDAYGTGEFLPVIEEFFDPEIVFKPAGILPETGEVQGHDGLLAFTQRQAEAFDQLSIEPEEIIDAGDQVIVPLRLAGRARFTGIPIEFVLVHLATFHDGRAVRVDVYADKAEALKAAGLSE